MSPDRCLRVPRPEPAVCEPAVGTCAPIGGVCPPSPAPMPTTFELLERFPAFYARQLTDAQVEELIHIDECGGALYPDGARVEVYNRLQGKAGRRPSSFREGPAFGLGKYWNSIKIVRPALIEPGPHRWSERRGRRCWVLTPLGRQVLAQFFCRLPKVRVAS